MEGRKYIYSRKEFVVEKIGNYFCNVAIHYKIRKFRLSVEKKKQQQRVEVTLIIKDEFFVKND